MATRSTIALEFADGTIGQVYCHWDGYLEHNGVILQKHYTDPFKVRELIDLGDLSSLQPEIGTKHKFDGFDSNDTCMFYGRDRGDADVQARYFSDRIQYLIDGQFEEYNYILRNVKGVATWFVVEGDTFKPLEEALVEAEQELV